ncbi:MAG TPA: hypothetical protein VNT42_09560 [Sphingomonas sp.]|nr:hypothetical protein [Sphingomonas sp.]
MSTLPEDDYFSVRERQSRENAEKAKDSNARLAHLELAKLYARRAADKGAG